MTRILVPRERRPGETRVAATPETVERLCKLGLEVQVEAGAGQGAWLGDEDYRAAGASVAGAPDWEEADLVLAVEAPPAETCRRLKRGAVLVSFLRPTEELDIVEALRDAGASAFAMELIPRISRAQKMDALSSQANIAGYKAVLLAAVELPRYFPLLMTAAGTVKPARVVVFGAGVAGLQAIATAKRLGAVVEATDIRPETKEQVESLGGRFIEVEGAEAPASEGGYAKEASEEYQRRQQEAVAGRVAEADVVITTAQVPGKRAPVLVPEAMVESMKPGAVIVDLAAAQGGNCALTECGRTVEHHGVRILGPENLPATVPVHASELYARNVLEVVRLLWKEEALGLDLEDEILDGALAVHQGEVRFAPAAEALKSRSPSA